MLKLCYRYIELITLFFLILYVYLIIIKCLIFSNDHFPMSKDICCLKFFLNTDPFYLFFPLANSQTITCDRLKKKIPQYHRLGHFLKMNITEKVLTMGLTVVWILRVENSCLDSKGGEMSTQAFFRFLSSPIFKKYILGRC